MNQSCASAPSWAPSPIGRDEGRAVELEASRILSGVKRLAQDIADQAELLQQVFRRATERLNEVYASIVAAADDAAFSGSSSQDSTLRKMAESHVGDIYHRLMRNVFVNLFCQMIASFDRCGTCIDMSTVHAVNNTATVVLSEPGEEGPATAQRLSSIHQHWDPQNTLMVALYHAAGAIPTLILRRLYGDVTQPNKHRELPHRFPPPDGSSFVVAVPQAMSDWTLVRRTLENGAWVRLHPACCGRVGQHQGGRATGSTFAMTSPVGTDAALATMLCIPPDTYAKALTAANGRMPRDTGARPRRCVLVTRAVDIPVRPLADLAVPPPRSDDSHSVVMRNSPVRLSANVDDARVGGLQALSPLHDSDSDADHIDFEALLEALDTGVFTSPHVGVAPFGDGLAMDPSAPVITRSMIADDAFSSAAALLSKRWGPRQEMRAPEEKASPLPAAVVTANNGSFSPEPHDEGVSSELSVLVGIHDTYAGLESQVVRYQHNGAENGGGAHKPSNGRLGTRTRRAAKRAKPLESDPLMSPLALPSSPPVESSAAQESEYAGRPHDAIFQISASVKGALKGSVTDAIQSLGCQLLASTNYQPRATHLIAMGGENGVERTEKFLSFRVAKKFIVNPYFVLDSAACGKLLIERLYVAVPLNIMPPLPRHSSPIFADWSVVLFAQPHIATGIATILRAGGCEHVYTPPFAYAEEWGANEAKCAVWIESVPWCTVTLILLEVSAAQDEDPQGSEIDAATTATAHVPCCVAMADSTSRSLLGCEEADPGSVLVTELERKVNKQLRLNQRVQFMTLEFLFQVICVPQHQQVLHRSIPIRYASLERAATL